MLRRLAPALRLIGVDAAFTRAPHDGRRRVNLTLAAPDAGVGLEGVGADAARALASIPLSPPYPPIPLQQGLIAASTSSSETVANELA
jgi:hypothetical protein